MRMDDYLAMQFACALVSSGEHRRGSMPTTGETMGALARQSYDMADAFIDAAKARDEKREAESKAKAMAQAEEMDRRIAEAQAAEDAEGAEADVVQLEIETPAAPLPVGVAPDGDLAFYDPPTGDDDEPMSDDEPMPAVGASQ